MSKDATGPPADRLAGLLEQSARGDEQAFALFYEATSARAHGVALRVLRNTALAEEVTQEGYLDAWRLAGRYARGRGSAVAWLLTLVHRRAVDRVRVSQASARREDAYRRHELAEAADVDTTSVPALAAVEAERVRAALAALSPEQRQAISLAYFGALTHSEVAAAVAAPLGTVKFRIRSGLRRLRSSLEALASEVS